MIRRAIGVAMVVGGLAGCGKPKVIEPVAGDLTVSYTGPGQADGALLVRITGAVTSVSGTGGYQVSSAAAGTNSTRVLVVGSLTPGSIFRVRVPDVAEAATYSASLEAVADKNTYALGDPLSYQLTISK
ncbi:MAG: hypothetical protein AB7L66_11865 [Gemmatimonadales bacterium]